MTTVGHCISQTCHDIHVPDVLYVIFILSGHLMMYHLPSSMCMIKVCVFLCVVCSSVCEYMHMCVCVNVCACKKVSMKSVNLQTKT